VLQVLKENGDVVRRGDVLVRMDETAFQDSVNSAEDNARNAVQALDQAERNLTTSEDSARIGHDIATGA
jgi:membrane fusion protein (multidrug efflux system)